MEDYEVISTDDILIKYDSFLKKQGENERRAKIRLIYSFGFIFTPFGKHFSNPFFKNSIKIGIISLTYSEIHSYLSSTFPLTKKNEDFEALISESIYPKRRNYVFLSLSLSAGLLLFVSSLILLYFFTRQSNFILLGTIFSTCLIYYWIAYQTGMVDQSRTAELYLKRGVLIQLFSVSSILLTLFLIYWNYSSPLIFLVYFFYLILFGYFNLIATKNLKNEWWQIKGVYVIRKYYNKV
ncbi:hypothetical protein [Mucilaginibacter lappiensis]|uniref:Sensor histidine kinase YesM n=1 Tax=Mucilaginibacter lappiensis TaxID=354630 RepID=A0A841JKG2_9SPHI|nr:hypothetical protein [Mucilaginibacter lappiensis]MBB6131490.1 sensor histidine kinase YesM [Mucilaginibacter lappiensis]